MHPQKPGWGWEPKKTWWAGAEVSLDLVGGTHSLHRVQSQVWSSSASWTPLLMTANGRSRAEKSKAAWGKKRHLDPHLQSHGLEAGTLP